MSDSNWKPNRRDLLKGSLAGAAYLTLSQAHAQTQSAGSCHVGFDYASYTVNDKTVQALSGEHMIAAQYYKADSYVVGASGVETRYLLCVEATLHAVESGAFAVRNTLTDIYVFNQANNELLFWRKIDSGDPNAGSCMLVVSPQQHSAQLKVTIVARCSANGYYGLNYNLPANPPDYKTAVVAHDATKLCAGVPLTRPYIAPSASGGQGDMGVLHRPNIIIQSDTLVRSFLGGNLNGSGKHPRFAANHYVIGGALFDQNGNMISAPQTILYSAAGDHELTFPVASLAASKVKVLRVVLFDSLQGRLMSFLDVA